MEGMIAIDCSTWTLKSTYYSIIFLKRRDCIMGVVKGRDENVAIFKRIYCNIVAVKSVV